MHATIPTVSSGSRVSARAAAAGVRRLGALVSRLDRLALPVRIAIVATSPSVLILARVYVLYREMQHAPADHRVFANTKTRGVGWQVRFAVSIFF